MDAFDGDLETAQMRLRNLAEAACKVLDANVLNLASFHLCAYMDIAMKYKGRLKESMVSELADEQLNAVSAREAARIAGAPPKPAKRSRSDAKEKKAPKN